MSKLCTGCGQPTDRVLSIPRLRLTLPYHVACAAAAQRELATILHWPDSILPRGGPVSGPLLTKESH